MFACARGSNPVVTDDDMTDLPDVTGLPVVVGVDGSNPSLAAVDLAAVEAARRGLPLELVHALLVPAMSLPVGGPPDLPPMQPPEELNETAFREYAEGLLSSAGARVRATHPDLAMISRLRDGYPGQVLTDASGQATLVVVGHRGIGGFAELLTGSVGLQLANHAAAPVIIVRGEADATGPVVVGVDGSDGSRRAAEFAAEAAAVHNAALLVLYAWPVDAAWSPALAQAGLPPPTVPAEVTELLATLSQKYPQVPVHTEVRHGVIPAHSELVEASKHARLVVVGTRGHGGFRGLLLGSVSQALINHAHCPVAVVGPGASPR
jgi:nucleotide-binding universal stress UspA family protein